GFDGVIVSDDIGAAVAISNIPPGTRAIDFLQAGGDLIISKYVQPADQMADAVLTLAGSNSAFRSRADDAAMRVLRAKEASGRLPAPSSRPARSPLGGPVPRSSRRPAPRQRPGAS